MASRLESLGQRMLDLELIQAKYLYEEAVFKKGKFYNLFPDLFPDRPICHQNFQEQKEKKSKRFK